SKAARGNRDAQQGRSGGVRRGAHAQGYGREDRIGGSLGDRKRYGSGEEGQRRVRRRGDRKSARAIDGGTTQGRGSDVSATGAAGRFGKLRAGRRRSRSGRRHELGIKERRHRRGGRRRGETMSGER